MAFMNDQTVGGRVEERCYDLYPCSSLLIRECLCLASPCAPVVDDSPVGFGARIHIHRLRPYDMHVRLRVLLVDVEAV